MSNSILLQEFRCADGEKCIAEFQKCNHRKECTDGSDEENCSKLFIQVLHTTLKKGFDAQHHKGVDAKSTPSYSSDLHFFGIIMQFSDL